MLLVTREATVDEQLQYIGKTEQKLSLQMARIMLAQIQFL